MKHMRFSALLSVTTLLCAPLVTAAPNFIPRSQSWNDARELAGWAREINLYDMEKFYGSFSLTPEYTQSFNANSIARELFDGALVDHKCPHINIAGSAISNRPAGAWLADYFGLPRDFEGTISVKPRVENFLIDINLYLGLDEWLCGLYFRAHAPFVHTRWKLNYCEVSTKGVLDHPEGYFSPVSIPNGNLLNSFSDFIANEQAPILMTSAQEQQLNTNVVFTPLTHSKFTGGVCSSAQTLNGLAEIQAVIGWNFLQDEWYHLGVGMKVCAPTGSKIKSEFLFEPIVGNGHAWELGAQATGHYTFWESECEDRALGLYVDVNATHLFKAHQRRSFDLKGRPNSRYMLAELMTTSVSSLFTNPNAGVVVASTAPNLQFNRQFSPVANLTTLDVNVSAAQVEVTAMLSYQHDCISFDLGYDFWMRGCERIQQRCNCPNPIVTQSWALKGDAHVYGFTRGTDITFPADQPIALSATESTATICAGTNNNLGTSGFTNNAGVDNPQFATASTTDPDGILNDRLSTSVGPAVQIQSSNPAIPLTVDDIDFCGARTKSSSNKVFSHCAYYWTDNEDYTPYLGIGFEAEFGSKGKSDCSTNNNGCGAAPLVNTSTSASPSSCGTSSCETKCSGCTHIALSQWGVWVKGGVSFN